MKKLIFVALIAISACNTIEKQTSLPIEVISLKESKKYDTILTIETNIAVHQFNKQENYIGSYEKQSEYPIVFFMGMMAMFFLGLIIYSIKF